MSPLSNPQRGTKSSAKGDKLSIKGGQNVPPNYKITSEKTIYKQRIDNFSKQKTVILQKFRQSIKGVANERSLSSWLIKYPLLQKDFGSIWWELWGRQDEYNRETWHKAIALAQEKRDENYKTS